MVEKQLKGSDYRAVQPSHNPYKAGGFSNFGKNGPTGGGRPIILAVAAEAASNQLNAGCFGAENQAQESNFECYECGEPGHMSSDCRNTNGNRHKALLMEEMVEIDQEGGFPIYDEPLNDEIDGDFGEEEGLALLLERALLAPKLEDEDDEIFSKPEKESRDEMIIERAREDKSDMVFQSLEHLQAIEYQMALVSALGNGKVLDLLEAPVHFIDGIQHNPADLKMETYSVMDLTLLPFPKKANSRTKGVATFIKGFHDQVISKVEKSNVKYQADADWHRIRLIFRERDLVWVVLRDSLKDLVPYFAMEMEDSTTPT